MQTNVREHCEPCASAQTLDFEVWQLMLVSVILNHQVPASPFTLQEVAALGQGLLAEQRSGSLHDLPFVQGQFVKGVQGQRKAVLGHQLSIAQLPVRIEDLLARLQGPGCNDLHKDDCILGGTVLICGFAA